MNILAIDTSTKMMAVALLNKNKEIQELTSESRNDHSRLLMPSVHNLMEQAKIKPEALDCIVVANGPGSYTGTRIGVTTAKTMAWALHIPIKTVSTLKLLAYNGLDFNGYVCPFIDARRGMVYTALYRWRKGVLETVKSETNILLSDWLTALKGLKEPILFLSGDMDVHQALIEVTCNNAVIPLLLSEHRIRPANLFVLAELEDASAAHEVVPNYLRLTEAETKWNLKQQMGDESHA